MGIEAKKFISAMYSTSQQNVGRVFVMVSAKMYGQSARVIKSAP
jgi:hypothetical protein